MCRNPRKSFRMREDRHVPCQDHLEEKVLQLGWRRVMRRFNEDVARIGGRKQAGRTEAAHEKRGYVNVRPSGQLKRDVLLIENFLEPRGGEPNLRTGIMV